MRVKHPTKRKQVDRVSVYQDDHRAAQHLHNLRRSRDCGRCGGLLVPERMDSPADRLLEQHIPGLRCVQCGDIVDQIILRNRLDPVAARRHEVKDEIWEDQPETLRLHAVEQKESRRNTPTLAADAA